MTFFEQELRKIVEPRFPTATYVGRACYVDLGGSNRAKIYFTTNGHADHYSALQLEIINRIDGKIDSLRVRLGDVWGKKQVTNPNFREGVSPYIWDSYGKVDWYVYHPVSRDYAQLTEAVIDYLEVFMDRSQTADQQWEQTMS